MKFKTSIMAAALLASASGIALAESTTTAPAVAPAPGAVVTPAPATTAVTTSNDDAVAIQTAPVSLSQAIAAAEAKEPGRTVEAEFDATSDGPRYDVKLLTENKLIEYTIDGTNGNILDAADQIIEVYFTSMTPGDIREAKVGLTDAIKAAETHAGGKAIDAEASKMDDGLLYTVTVAAADGTSKDILVNGNDGRVKED
ncbi:PepSY domain-containing protein [Zavarzinia sp. CC-PAN008]|uniref:PepSY domain-containing protein n=1 Tax=Zavarzinia sp. CC-PAN008 TaxID=3243332 RepID=UPI003F74A512